MGQKIKVCFAELQETICQTISFLFSGNLREILCKLKNWIDIRLKYYIWDVDLLRNIILFILAALIVRFVFNEKYFENVEKIIKWIPNLIKYDNLFVLLEFCLIIGLFSIARIIARLFIAMKGIRFFLISFLGTLSATFWHEISEYLSVSIKFWLEKIADILSGITGNIFTFTNFINFIAATLLGIFLFLFLRWISSSSGIQILAFDDSGLDPEKKEDRLLMLNGNMIADLLAAELHRIDHIYKFIEDGKLQVVQTSSSLLGICRENLELSLLKGELLAYSLTQAGSLPITDKTTLQLGFILLAIRQLWPAGLVRVISGSIGEFISTDGHLMLKLTARYERTNYHSDIHAYNIDQESSDININDMVKNLAYQIALDASSKPIPTNNWEAFKFFTEAMSSFYRYERTKSANELDKSFQLCEKANKKDKNYKKVGDLLGLIGFAYLNRDQYGEAKKSLEKALEINPNSVFVQIFVGDLYYLSGEYDKAFKHYEYAKKLDPHRPEIYIRTGRIHIVASEPDLKAYDQARQDLWYVFNLEPRNSAAQSIIAWLDFLCYLEENLKGHDKKAKIILDKAFNRLRKIPQDKKTHLDYGNTAIFYLYKGNEEEALKNWWKALQICPCDSSNATISDEVHHIFYKLLIDEEIKHSINLDKLKQILKERKLPLYKRVVEDLIIDADIIRKKNYRTASMEKFIMELFLYKSTRIVIFLRR